MVGVVLMKQDIIKDSLQRIKGNFSALLCFELLYKLCITLLFVPVFIWMFQWSMDISGYRYLDHVSIWEYLVEPSTILILMVLLVLMTIVSLIEIQAVIICYQASKQHQKIKAKDMLFHAMHNVQRIMKRKNRLLIVFVLLIIPLTNTAAISGLISSIHIPEYITDYIADHILLLVLFLIVIGLFYILSLRWCLSLHAYTLHHDTFKQARKRSTTLMKGMYLKTLGYFIIWQLMLYVIVSLIAFLCCFIVVFVIKNIAQDREGYGIAITCIAAILIVSFSLLLYCSLPLSIALLSALYDAYEQRVEVQYNDIVFGFYKKRRLCYVLRVGLCCLFLLAVGGVQNLRASKVNIFDEIYEMPDVSAHRGDSKHAPENTIPAFQKAIEIGADWIELDVRQTMDGEIVVHHDASLKRTAGVEKNIHDLSYAELRQYDVGSWFSTSYQGLQVSTLDEVLRLYKGKVKFIVELKPTGNEVDFEQRVIDIMKHHKMQDDCIMASLNKNVLKHVKQVDPNVQTMYIMSIALGRVSDISFADQLSVEASFVTRELLQSIHQKGKKLTAWTINQEDKVKQMIYLGVDNIVSDDPSYVQQIIAQHQSSDWIGKLIAPLFPNRT